MTSLMRDWLGPFVQHELEKAIDWKKSTAYDKDGQHSDYNLIVKNEEDVWYDYDVESRSITDDGSNLRVSAVLSDGYEHAVQIINYLQYEHPVKAVLSDSHTSIIAKFSKAATEAYERTHKRKITKITAGGVMAIRRCDVVATTFGPEAERLSLLITEFSYRGCNGSSTFGRPTPAEQRPRIESCIQDLLCINKFGPSERKGDNSMAKAGLEAFSSQVSDQGTVPYSSSPPIPVNHEAANSDGRLASQVEKTQGVNVDGPRTPAAADVTRKSRKDKATAKKKSKKGKTRDDHVTSTPVRESFDRFIAEQRKDINNVIMNMPKKIKTPIRKKQSLTSESVESGGNMQLADNKKKVPDWMPIPAITRRSCLPPADQMKLLSRRDAWIPSEPGFRFPLASVPIKTLDRLKKSGRRSEKEIFDGSASGDMKGKARGNRDEGNFARQENSDMGDPNEEDSEELSWAATGSDGTDEGLPPDSSAIQECLTPDSHRRENSMLIGRGAESHHSSQSNESSDLEVCLPRQMQAQVESTLSNARELKQSNDLDVDEQCSDAGNVQMQLAAQRDSYKAVASGEDAEKRLQSAHQSSSANATMVVPNTPSIQMDRPKSPNEQISNEQNTNQDTQSLASREVSLAASSAAGTRSTYTDGRRLGQTDKQLRLEMNKRNCENYNDNALERKKIKVQHLLSAPTQDSVAFIDSARLAHEAKKRFLNTLAEAKIDINSVNAALQSTNAAQSLTKDISQSLTDHTDVSTGSFDICPPEEKISKHTIQLANAHEKNSYKSSIIPSGKSSSCASSTTRSQLNVKCVASVGTSSISPQTNNLVYTKFRDEYMDYTGDLKHFIGICRMLSRSHKAGTAQHRSLWDDFMIKHFTDYGPYLISCHAASEDPIPYEQYYRDRVDEPCHNKRILTPESLREALESNGRSSSATSVGVADIRSSNFRTSNEFGEGAAQYHRSSPIGQSDSRNGFIPSSPVRAQYLMKGQNWQHSEDSISTTGSTHILPRRGRNGYRQEGRHDAASSSLKSHIENQDNSNVHDDFMRPFPYSTHTPNHVSENRATTLPSSPLVNILDNREGELDQLKQLPSSAGLKINKRQKTDTEAKHSNAGDATNGDDLASQNNTKYDRGRAMISAFPASSYLKTTPIASILALTNSTDSTVSRMKQVQEHNIKTNLSSVPISSTTNQILQLLPEAEQPLHRKDLPSGREATREQQVPATEPWWREQHTIFKEFVSGYARLKNVNGALGTPLQQTDKIPDKHLSEGDPSTLRVGSSSDLTGREVMRTKRKSSLNADQQILGRNIDVFSWNL